MTAKTVAAVRAATPTETGGGKLWEGVHTQRQSRRDCNATGDAEERVRERD